MLTFCGEYAEEKGETSAELLEDSALRGLLVFTHDVGFASRMVSTK